VAEAVEAGRQWLAAGSGEGGAASAAAEGEGGPGGVVGRRGALASWRANRDSKEGTMSVRSVSLSGGSRTASWSLAEVRSWRCRGLAAEVVEARGGTGGRFGTSEGASCSAGIGGMTLEEGSICRVGRRSSGMTVGREESRRRRRSFDFNSRGLADGTGGVGRMPADGSSREEAAEYLEPMSMRP
jgi:hypothetical protein